MPTLKHISRKALAFTLMQFAIGFGHYARCILTAMLQHAEGIIKPRINV
jgi:hypothetical protein